MGLVYIVLILAALPPFAAVLPARAAGIAFGSIALIAGLLLLQAHTTPFGEDHDRLGLGNLILVGWIALAAAALAVRLAWQSWRGDLDAMITPRDMRALSWMLPVGILAGVLAMHWLSNRLAGARPAWLAHVAAFLIAALIAAGIGVRARSKSRGPGVMLAIVAASTLALLVAAAAVMAPIWAMRARSAAAGAPYCLLAFAGRDHPRAARSVFDLSPLVSRSGGRSFVDDADWLIVATPEGLRARRWQAPFGRASGFDDSLPLRSTACRPVAGGTP
ncbi:hypothetical protein [uncultured Sphingomonas sp.]|uniref:hypothetical protein n=1 Tax=uncultured Sphingomonas sp. TaxID=158754 RepID=UPI0035CBB354